MRTRGRYFNQRQKSTAFYFVKASGRITNCDHLARLRFAKSLLFDFTEHGALMAATEAQKEMHLFQEIKQTKDQLKELCRQMNKPSKSHDDHLEDMSFLKSFLKLTLATFLN